MKNGFLIFFNFINSLTISLVNGNLDINSKDSVKFSKAFSFLIWSKILKIITMKVTEILKVATNGATTLPTYKWYQTRCAILCPATWIISRLQRDFSSLLEARPVNADTAPCPAINRATWFIKIDKRQPVSPRRLRPIPLSTYLLNQGN